MEAKITGNQSPTVLDRSVSCQADSSASFPVTVAADPLALTSLEPPASVEDASPPLNWRESRTWFILVTISGMSFIVNLSTVICAPSSIQISNEFGSHSYFLSVFYITVWNLGEALAPLYIGPLSERLGRLSVYHFSNILFIVFAAVTGFSTSIGMIVAFRFLTGMVTASICLNPSIVGDMFALQKRGAGMSILSLMPLVGTALGPIVGGYVTQHLGWRWTFWLTAILTGVVELVMAFVFRETYLPYILRRREQKITIDTRSLNTPVAAKPKSLYMLPWTVLRFLSRPFVILFGSRTATIMALYLSNVYAYLFLLAATLATVFQEVYSFSETNSGLVYLGLTVGMLIGTLFCCFTLDRSIVVATEKRAENDTSLSESPAVVRLEKRLLPAVPCMVILPAALFMYGWSLDSKTHWAVPVVATVFAGFCLSATTIPIMNYFVDLFKERSASAIAPVLPLRYVLGTFLPVAAPYMYKRLDYGRANSLLAFVLILCLPLPLLLIIPINKSFVLNGRRFHIPLGVRKASNRHDSRTGP